MARITGTHRQIDSDSAEAYFDSLLDAEANKRQEEGYARWANQYGGLDTISKEKK